MNIFYLAALAIIATPFISLIVFLIARDRMKKIERAVAGLQARVDELSGGRFGAPEPTAAAANGAASTPKPQPVGPATTRAMADISGSGVVEASPLPVQSRASTPQAPPPASPGPGASRRAERAPSGKKSSAVTGSTRSASSLP